MAVKIRLARRGRKKLAMYDVVVTDARSPRDGKFIEKIGTYNPLTNPATINLQDERAFHWLMNGALPSCSDAGAYIAGAALMVTGAGHLPGFDPA